MTIHEIIKMAKESDLGFLLGESWLMHYEIEHFAKLVAQHERESCAKMVDVYIGFDNELSNNIRARGQA